MESNEEKPKKLFLKRGYKIALGLFIFLILLPALLTWILVTFYADEIKNQIAQKINTYLAVPIDVKEIDFTVWKTFPLASLDFKEIKIYDALQKNKEKTFLEAEHLYLSFNLLDIINKSYKVKACSVDDAKINLRFNNKGEGNYKFWKESNAPDTSFFKLHLKDIKGSKVDFSFNYPAKKQSYRLFFDEINLNGTFGQQSYTLAVNTQAYVKMFVVGGINYIEQKNIHLALKLAVTNNKKFVIKVGDLILAKVPFSIQGTVTNNDDYVDIDLKVNEHHAEVNQLLSLLPQNLQAKLNDYKGKGNIKVAVNIKGKINDEQAPDINALFDLKEASFNYKDVALTNIHIAGNYSNGTKQANSTSVLVLKNFTAYFQNQPIRGSITIANFDTPTAHGNLEGNVNLTSLNTFLKFNEIENLTGNADFNFNFSWPLHGAQEKKRLLTEYKTEGFLKLHEVGFNIQQRVAGLTGFNAELSFNNEDIKINTLTGNINKSDIALVGYFENIIPYFTGLSKKLSIDAKLKSNVLMLDEVFAFQQSGKENSEYFNVIFPDNLNFIIDAQVDQLLFKKFEAKKFSGQLKLQNRKLAAQNLVFSAFNGNLSLEGMVDGQDTTRLKITCHSLAQDININQFFYQLDNFGQNYLTDKSVNGNLSAETDLQLQVNNALNIESKTIVMQSSLEINNGELTNYEPLFALSKFIEVNELKRVKFATLKNRIEIKDRLVTIPMMEIKSSALNISLAGTHTFDQFLDYYFKVGLRDLLASKAKKKKENQEFSEYEEKEKQINLFIHVKGPIDNLKFMYDRKGFKDQLKQEISNEKNTVKALLKQEFGLFKNDTSIKSLNKKNLPPIEIEWEENKQPSSVISEPANKKKLEVESPPNSPQKESQNKTLKKLLKQPTKTETEEDIN